MGRYWDGEDATAHWPPRYNPAYEREDSFSAWECEQRMALLAREANELAEIAAEHYGEGRDGDGDKATALHDRKWNEYNELKQQLAEYEAGW